MIPPDTHLDVDTPTPWHAFASDLPPDRVMLSEVLPPGAHWSGLAGRGTTLSLAALGGPCNLSLVLYAAHDRLERYNMPDSLKAQHTAHFTRGHVLMSDMGRALASITRDTLGWHDPLGLLLDDARMAARYGSSSYQVARNTMHRSGRSGLLIEIAKFGLRASELVAPVNFFSKVQVDEDGRLVFAPGHARAGDRVDLRFDMDVFFAVSSSPHPLDPAPDWPDSEVGLALWRSGAAPADDYCRHFRPENARALQLSEAFHLARGGCA